MVNNVGLIAETMVLSSGFPSASALSIKFLALGDLCREQFSHAHRDHWLSKPPGFKKNEKTLYSFDQ
jgi:hypothetical protein